MGIAPCPTNLAGYSFNSQLLTMMIAKKYTTSEYINRLEWVSNKNWQNTGGSDQVNGYLYVNNEKPMNNAAHKLGN